MIVAVADGRHPAKPRISVDPSQSNGPESSQSHSRLLLSLVTFPPAAARWGRWWRRRQQGSGGSCFYLRVRWCFAHAAAVAACFDLHVRWCFAHVRWCFARAVTAAAAVAAAVVGGGAHTNKLVVDELRRPHFVWRRQSLRHTTNASATRPRISTQPMDLRIPIRLAVRLG